MHTGNRRYGVVFRRSAYARLVDGWARTCDSVGMSWAAAKRQPERSSSAGQHRSGASCVASSVPRIALSSDRLCTPATRSCSWSAAAFTQRISLARKAGRNAAEGYGTRLPMDACTVKRCWMHIDLFSRRGRSFCPKECPFTTSRTLRGTDGAS